MVIYRDCLNAKHSSVHCPLLPRHVRTKCTNEMNWSGLWESNVQPATAEILSGIMFCACFHIFSWPAATAGLMARDGRINKLQFLLAATVMSRERFIIYRKRSLCVLSTKVTLLLSPTPRQHKVHDFCFGFFSRAHARSDGNSNLSKTNYRALDKISWRRRGGVGGGWGGGDIAGGL